MARKWIDTAALVHELQEKIASIVMLSESILMDERRHDLAWLDHRLSRIRETAKLMHRTVDAILRIRDDRPPCPERVDVSALCRKIVDGLATASPARTKIEIQEGMSLFGDFDELVILLENLVGNALKFSACSPQPELKVAAVNEDSRILISIEDNGVGISEEDRKRVFEPFARCHPEFQGTGIGLALAQRVVERHGGEIWVDARPGGGTVVSFFLRNEPQGITS